MSKEDEVGKTGRTARPTGVRIGEGGGCVEGFYYEGEELVLFIVVVYRVSRLAAPFWPRNVNRWINKYAQRTSEARQLYSKQRRSASPAEPV